jgi:hypothetical protein
LNHHINFCNLDDHDFIKTILSAKFVRQTIAVGEFPFAELNSLFKSNCFNLTAGLLKMTPLYEEMEANLAALIKKENLKQMLQSSEAPLKQVSH